MNIIECFLVSLGGWQSGEETNQVFSTKIYRLPYDLGPGKLNKH